MNFWFDKNKFLPILINRTVIFTFLICLLFITVYIAGTIQGFIDSTQLSLLKFYSIFGISLIVTSLCGTVIGIVRFFRNRKIRYLARASGYIFLVIFGLVTVLGSMFIITLTRGNSG